MTNNEWLSMIIALREMADVKDEKIAIGLVRNTLDKIYAQIEKKPAEENITKKD